MAKGTTVAEVFADVDNTREWFTLNRPSIARLLPSSCGNCGSKQDIQIHHVVPLKVGGTNRITNLVPLCRECHKRVHGGISYGKLRWARPRKAIKKSSALRVKVARKDLVRMFGWAYVDTIGGRIILPAGELTYNKHTDKWKVLRYAIGGKSKQAVIGERYTLEAAVELYEERVARKRKDTRTGQRQRHFSTTQG